MNRLAITLFAPLIFVLSWLNAIGQPEISGAYHVGNIKTYGIDNGLPDRCIMSAFVDSLGKMNVVPCAHVQLGYEQNIYQIDGYKPLLNGIITDVPEESGVFFNSGIGSGGVSYGVFLNFKGIKATGASAYFFDPVTGAVEIVRPSTPDGQSYNVWQVVRKDGVYYYLGHDGLNMNLLQRRDSIFSVITSFPLAKPDFAINRPLPMYLSDEALWFVLPDGLYRYAMDGRLLGHWEEVNLASLWAPEQSIDFHRMPDGTILIRDAHAGQVYMFHKQTNSILPYGGLPAMFGGAPETAPTYVYDDMSGNLLFIQKDNLSERYLGALCTANGDWHDYSDIVGPLTTELSNPFFLYNFQGEDFRSQIYRTGYDLIIAEVCSHAGIRTHLSAPVRGMAELGPDSVHIMGNRLVVEESEELNIIENYAVCPSERVYDSEIQPGIEESWWYSMDNGGITKRDPRTGICQVYFPDRNITRMVVESDSTIIFTTSVSEIVRWSLPEQSTITIDSGTINGFVNDIHVDGSGKIWLGTSTGLFLCERTGDNEKARRISFPGDNVAVLTILDDDRGHLWLGTFAKGLIIYEKETGETRILKEESGLSNNTVASLVIDNDSVIWAGTFRGITLLDDIQVIGHVYRKDGLIDNDCNRWSVLKTTDGDLYFGTPYGVSAIDPELVKAQVLERKAPSVYLSLIQTNDTTLIEGSAALARATRRGIQLPATDRNLRLAYALSDYSAPAQSKFAYRIGDGDWNYIGNVHDLDLIDLPKGEYHLYIKGADERGQWSSNAIDIPIYAAGFFYEQWWFYALCGMLVVLFAFLWQLRQRREKQQLEMQVASRTTTIRQQADALRELDRVKSKLYTNITHEFRTPLTVIDGMIDRAKTDPKAPGIIKRNVRNLLNLVNQMLDLRKLESGNLGINAVQSDITKYIRYIGESFGSIAHSKGITVEYRFEPDTFIMDFDPDKIERILSNLLSNALKFTPRGGRMEISATGTADILTVSVADSGMGIAPADQEKVFQRFYQVDTEMTRSGEGTGIGLTLVSELLQLLGGSIVVESEIGQGSTFTFTLPVTRDAGLVDTLVTSEHDIAHAGITSTVELDAYIESQSDDDGDLILLVEDNLDVLRYIATCLKDEFNLAYATDGSEGIEKAIELTPSIIISDVMMPEITGYELCDTLKQDVRTSHIPIILLTAKADLESKIEGLRYGADAYLQKPFNREELEITIRNLIANRKKVQERYSSFNPFPPAADELTRSEDAFILSFRTAIEENIDREGFGIPELCQTLHLGKTQLHKKIKSLTGKTPIQYMRSVKLHRAGILLLTGENITQVAFDLGFSDPKYFARVFKEEYGMPPSDYVKEKRSDYS